MQNMADIQFHDCTNKRKLVIKGHFLYKAQQTPKCNLCFVILKTDGSCTKLLISHLKSKHRVHVIHESEDHEKFQHRKRSDRHLCNWKWVFLRLRKRGPITFFHVYNRTMPYFQSSPHQCNRKEGFFSHRTNCHTTQKQTERWEHRRFHFH